MSEPLEFRIDPERVTIGDLVAIEDGEDNSVRFVRDILARFVIDPATGEYPADPAGAAALINRLTLPEAKAAAQQITERLRSLQDDISPPA